jgi:ribonuclease HII
VKFKLDLHQHPTPWIGIDEVGRGCLAGPVVAAAVIFKSETDTDLYFDSKTISEPQREILSTSIHQHHWVGIGWASVEEIDEINILQATFRAMHRAVDLVMAQAGLDPKKEKPTLFIDGRDRVPSLGHYNQVPIIKGDQHLRLISAASLAAKVARDQFMIELAREGADYGFEKHKGYGTEFHRGQIQKFGPCKWHRQSFGGVKEFIAKEKAGELKKDKSRKSIELS